MMWLSIDDDGWRWGNVRIGPLHVTVATGHEDDGGRGGFVQVFWRPHSAGARMLWWATWPRGPAEVQR